ncbi:uncharacterized protein FYN16_005689 [Cariama cristata]
MHSDACILTLISAHQFKSFPWQDAVIKKSFSQDAVHPLCHGCSPVKKLDAINFMINQRVPSLDGMNHLRDKVISVTEGGSSCKKQPRARLADLPVRSPILFCPRDMSLLQQLTKTLFFCSENPPSTMPAIE